MREITLDSLSDDRLQSEAQRLISMLRAKYPKLDFRRGTVLRDLLVDTDAAIGTLFAQQAEEQRLSSSLVELVRRSESGETVDATDVAAIMSNFNMAPNNGTKAKGYVRVVVSNKRDHVLLKGIRFHTVDGIYFVSTSDVSASINPSGEQQVKQYEGVSNFWYLVPVEAEAVGSAGNIGQGTALETPATIADFVSASAYTAFSQGSDLEALDKTVARIQDSLSVRSLTTKTGIESVVRDRLDDTENPVVAISVCGYGNPAQLRDKHNLFGVAVGGRVDVYVRNFTNLPVTDSLVKTGKLISDPEADTGTFSISVPASEVPGIISVYSVSDADAQSLASYAFSATYPADVSATWHDIRVTDTDTVEAANTVWRGADILVSDVPVSEEVRKSREKTFRVVLTRLPAADELQSLVDDGTARNEGTDIVVRGPMIVNVSIKAVVRYSHATGFDKDKARADICSYVNTRGFVGRLARSEIASLLTDCGAVSVDLFDEDDMLYGYVYGADGKRRDLFGDALDVDNIEDPAALLTKDTTVFAVEEGNIQITTIAVD